MLLYNNLIFSLCYDLIINCFHISFFSCKRFDIVYRRSTSKSDEEKHAVLKQQEDHLAVASQARLHYRDMIAKAKSKKCMHISFDMAQQVHYPSNPLQPGPVYFKTPRKCAIFGITDESLPRQTNYLVDEAISIGKGCNSVISYLHHYLETHQSDEAKNSLIIHADNCAGQNKNNYMLMYLAWRVAKGCHHRVELNFMIAGHTKFGPDLFFGIFKRRYRKEFVSSLDEIKHCIERSSTLNLGVLVGSQDGKVLVPTYDWSSYLQTYYRKIPGIKTAHQFVFDSKSPENVTIRQFSNSTLSATQSFNIKPIDNSMPDQLMPLGLPVDRQHYLYNNIREFCKEHCRDLVCPPVKIPKTLSNTSDASSMNECPSKQRKKY